MSHRPPHDGDQERAHGARAPGSGEGSLRPQQPSPSRVSPSPSRVSPSPSRVSPSPSRVSPSRFARAGAQLEKLYYRIGEVSHIVGVEPHVLRYWETEFRSVRPQKSARGQRIYSRRDVDTLLKVKELLYGHRFTIAGAKQKLREGGFEPAPAPAPLVSEPAPQSGAPQSGPPQSGPTCGIDEVRALRDELLDLRALAAGFLEELAGGPGISSESRSGAEPRAMG